MQQRPISLPLLLVSSFAVSSFAVLPGCKSSSRSPNVKRDINPPIVAENDVIRAEVRKVEYIAKRTSLRIWLDLANKTDDTLQMGYGEFAITVEGRNLRGALRVPFVRVDKPFEMPPRFVKHISQPIEFLTVPSVAAVDLQILNIRRIGKDGTAELVVHVPVDDTVTEKPPTEPGKSAPGNTETPKTEAPKTEEPKTEAPKTEAPKSEPAKVEPGKTDPAKNEGGSTGQGSTEQGSGEGSGDGKKG